MGVAGLQTLIDHEAAANAAVLSANITTGTPAVGERLATTAAMLASRGLDAAAATAASTGLLGRAVANQSAVMTFDKAFIAVSLVFVVAAPLLIGVKLALGRRAGSATLRSRGGEDP
jgi:DHA2 family multidrug resistance protein